MSLDFQRLEQVLAEAAAQGDLAERAAFLAQACGEDRELRTEVERLLVAHQQAGDFLETPVRPTAEGIGGAAVDKTEALPASDLPIEGAGARIGRYKLLEEIGEGAFGVVYMAEQLEPVQRQVALKIIKAGMDTREVVARFEAERQALALMDHPSIARVFDGGVTRAGRPYFVMELVQGIAITEFCDQRNLATPERLELFIQVCRAVQHAHQKGIIHRDLKPSNILITLIDGQPVPKVIDFGVAKALGRKLTDKTLFTGFLRMIGTPAYMSPEQADLSGVDVDTRSDIYALGVLLYELLTGVTPFDAETLHHAALDEIRHLIRETEPPKPSTRISRMDEPERTTVAKRRQAGPATLSRLVRGDLDWIVMKCLEKERGRRYETANGLALDIEHHLKQEPVTAAAPTLRYRLAKFTQRNRAALATTAAFVLLLVAGAALSVWEAVRATRNAAHAADLAAQESQQRQRATASAQESREHLVQLYLANGNRLLETGDHLGALGWFAEALNLERDDPQKEASHRLRILSVMKQSPKLLHLWFHGASVNSAEFSQDGSCVITASDDQTARVWDVSTGEALTPPLLHGGAVHKASFSPDGRQVLTAADRGRLWNARSGELERMLDHRSLEDAIFSPDGRLIVTAGVDHTIRIWDAASGLEAAPRLQNCRLPAGGQNPAHPAFSLDGRRLLTLCYDATTRVWDVRTGVLLLTLSNKSTVFHATFSPDGALIATADRLKTARLWDAATGREVMAPLRHQAAVGHVAFSGEGQRLVSSSDDGSAKLWDIRTGELVRTYADGSGHVLASIFSPDGRQLLLRHFRGPVRLWSTEAREAGFADGLNSLTIVGPGSLGDAQPASCPLLHGARPTSACFHPDGQRVLTACADGSVRLWDITPDGSRFWPWSDPPRTLLSTSSSGHRAVTELASGALELWDTRTWRRTGPELPLTNRIVRAFFSRDDRRLLTLEQAWRGGRSLLECNTWDVSSATLLGRTSIENQAGATAAALVAASSDCVQIAMGAHEALECWDVAEGRRLWRAKPRGTVRRVQFTPDKRWVTVCAGRSVEVIESATGQEPYPPLTNKLDVSAVVFSPDGRLIITTCSDYSYDNGEARIWEAATGRLLLALEHRDGVKCAAVDLEGRRLATGTKLGIARVYDLASGQPLTPEMRPGAMVRSVAFSPDGRRLATGAADAACVWDLGTGQALTPPLRESRGVSEVLFLGNGEYLATSTRGRVRMWKLPVEVRPAEDVIALARLLPGQHVDPTGVLEPLTVSVLSNAWSQLRARWPRDFAFVPDKALPNAPGRGKPPARLPQAGTNLVDLSGFYNAALDEDWHGMAENNLAALPEGVQTLAQVQFDVRGVIQLAGTELQTLTGSRYPASVAGIPIHRKFARLHVLHGTGWAEQDAKKIGACVLHYADGRQSELPILHGEDVRDWWHLVEHRAVTRAAIAWTGSNPRTDGTEWFLRLYKRTWDNPRPEVEVESLDFTSTVTKCAPFLIALTLE